MPRSWINCSGHGVPTTRGWSLSSHPSRTEVRRRARVLAVFLNAAGLGASAASARRARWLGSAAFRPCTAPGLGGRVHVEADNVEYFVDEQRVPTPSQQPGRESNGGPTTAENMLALCPSGHRLHHRGTISLAAPLVYKRMLVSLNESIGRDARELLLFLALDLSNFSFRSPAVFRVASLVVSDVARPAARLPGGVAPAIFGARHPGMDSSKRGPVHETED
jgi:hypothetical protein